jgi:hypothetical protein
MGKEIKKKTTLEETLENNFNQRIYNYFLDKTKEKGFQERVVQYNKMRAKMNEVQYRAELRIFCSDYGLDPYKWIDILYSYIHKGIIPRPDENYSLPATVFTTKSIKYFDNDVFPVTLGISPFASQRDLISYIKSFYSSQIRPIQEQAKQSLKDSPVKTRRKKSSVRERNEFIYQHRLLPRKTIVSLVATGFGEYLDYGNVGKIISLEKARREKK